MENPKSRLVLPLAIAFTCVFLIVAMVVLVMPGLWQQGNQTTSSAVRIGGEFALTSHTGAPFTDKDLQNRPAIVFFGFTHCPEICPTTLYDISQILDVLGDDAGKVNTVFVSVDPERDTTAVLADYLSSFHTTITGLTGSLDNVAAMAKAYRVYYKKVPLEGGDYTVDHTAVVYLFDKEGNFIAPLKISQDPETAAAPIRRLL